MCACACLSEAPRGSGPGPLGPFLLPLTRGFGQIWRGHKITTYPFSPRKNGRKGMAQSQGWVRRYFKAFCKGFFVAVPVAVTFLDRVACVARVEGASMQPSLNPGGSQSSDVVLLNHWKVRNFEVQRGDIVSLVQQPTRPHHPWDSPGKNTGVGCHFLLQCMKVKSESEVVQSCPTLRDPMDCSLPGSSIHGIFQARVLEWVAIAFSALLS
ncbi:mitochondrial inner membrane protease subunit 2 isoform X2 [Bubalus kerabau]|uniref:mitochondrial inner membrane protease subunit 2 isoform X2 n=1 Tax=Bubalus carabanensis TaxID=3119969 RepID=UPI00244E86BF|nr:mitochondrial inner membrane protease subunit 2 isoform X2 [Bubalus carabanensis]